MKKNVYLVMAAVVAMASCTKNEVVETSSPNEISFGTFIGKQTKASVIEKETLSEFVVDAYFTGIDNWDDRTEGDFSTFMNETKITRNPYDGACTYDGTKYWPNKVDGVNLGKVSFFTYAHSAPTMAEYIPSISKTDATADADFKINYTMPLLAARQVDLIADMKTNQTKISNETKEGTVKFTFKHLLSKIIVSAQAADDYDGATITVTDLRIGYKGIASTGVYTMNNTDPKWDVPGTPIIGSSGSILTKVEADKTLNTTVREINDAGLYPMLIPQTLADSALTITLVYTVKDSDNLVITNTETVNIKGITLEASKQYNFLLSVSLNAVEFEVTDVSLWGDTVELQPVL